MAQNDWNEKVRQSVLSCFLALCTLMLFVYLSVVLVNIAFEKHQKSLILKHWKNLPFFQIHHFFSNSPFLSKFAFFFKILNFLQNSHYFQISPIFQNKKKYHFIIYICFLRFWHKNSNIWKINETFLMIFQPTETTLILNFHKAYWFYYVHKDIIQ